MPMATTRPPPRCSKAVVVPGLPARVDHLKGLLARPVAPKADHLKATPARPVAGVRADHPKAIPAPVEVILGWVVQGVVPPAAVAAARARRLKATLGPAVAILEWADLEDRVDRLEEVAAARARHLKATPARPVAGVRADHPKAIPAPVEVILGWVVQGVVPPAAVAAAGKRIPVVPAAHLKGIPAHRGGRAVVTAR
jgi:hypothetical protein